MNTMAARSTTKKNIIGYNSEHCGVETETIVPKLNLNGPPKKKTKQLKHTFKNSRSTTDENSALRASLQKLDDDHRRMQKTLEDTVADAEERLKEMKRLLDKKEEIQRAQMDEVTKKNLDLEEKVSKYEKHLLSSNTDPVRLQTLEPTSDDNESVEEKRKISKTRVKKMRERLRQMNEKTQTFLTDIQNMKQQLQELEDMGTRIGHSNDDEDDFIPAVAPAFRPEDLQVVVSEANKTVESGGDVSQIEDAAGSLFITEDTSDQT